jgi:hypothetical protein
MYLTREEEKMLKGEYGEGKRKSIEILVTLGKIYNAERLISVTSVQIAGVSYHNIGDAGISFLKDISKDAKVEIKATLNPAGMDVERWEELGFDEKFAKKQIEIVEIFKSMGVEETLTCTPYLVGNVPSKGEHIAWSESSAVTFANSVLGAMTNRESGISALASAIIGKTPYYGMHLKEKRAPKVKIRVNLRLAGLADYAALGHAIAKKVKNEIPIIEGIKKVGLEELKMLSASIATFAGLATYHISNITNECKDFREPKEKVDIGKFELKEAYEYLNDDCDEIDFVCIGCPHCSLEEIRMVAKLLEGRKVSREFWIVTSRKVKEKARKLGYVKVIENSGAKVVCDTCMAVAPLKPRFKTLATNSAKACYYGRGVNKFKVKFGDIRKCVYAAVKGVWR